MGACHIPLPPDRALHYWTFIRDILLRRRPPGLHYHTHGACCSFLPFCTCAITTTCSTTMPCSSQNTTYGLTFLPYAFVQHLYLDSIPAGTCYTLLCPERAVTFLPSKQHTCHSNTLVLCLVCAQHPTLYRAARAAIYRHPAVIPSLPNAALYFACGLLGLLPFSLPWFSVPATGLTFFCCRDDHHHPRHG